MLENRMLIDAEWGEIEYGVPLNNSFDCWENDNYDEEWEESDDQRI